MQIPINKTVIAGALPALGKLVSRTSATVFHAVQIEGHDNILYFRTCNATERIEFRMLADINEVFPPILVEFEQFRLAVRNSKNKTLKLDVSNGLLSIECVKLTPVKGSFPELEMIPEQDSVATTSLPENFVEMLSAAAPLVDLNEDRSILHGMNLSADGLTATNGKELFNCPYPFKLDELTIPFPLALMATKAKCAGELKAWNNDLCTMFSVRIGNWTWTAKALPGAYPNWKRIVPDDKSMKHIVSFTAEQSGRLKLFLKTVPETKMSNGILIYRDESDTLTLRDKDGHDIGVPVDFSAWDDFRVIIRKEILQHLLNQGHTALAFIDGLSPFIGSGGIGRYIAMPMCARIPKEEVAQKPEQVAFSQTDVKSAVQPEQSEPHTPPESTESVSVQNSPHPQESPTSKTTNTRKESSSMNDTTITRTESAPVQTVAQNHEQNPLDELAATIEAMKTKLKAMFDESAAMSRKVREVALAQRQKEREYVQTKRTIERIRTASGF